MNKIKESKTSLSKSSILIVDYSRRDSRVYSLETHKKATLPIKTSKSLVKLNQFNHKRRYKSKNKKEQLKNGVLQPLTKPSTRSYNRIESFSIGTHHGLHYITNQDTVSIQLGNRSIFGLFDGYNGTFSSTFLKKMLMEKAQWSSSKSVETNVCEIFNKLDCQLLKQQEQIQDSSGSSALLCLFDKQMIFTANCGTSLAFGKTNTGKLIRLNNIHNCQNQQERRRVIESKGSFYRTRVELDDNQNFVQGPIRLTNYKTIQTRTLGYPLTKDRKVVISQPQIKYIKTKNLQWVCLTTSGLLTVLNDIQMFSIIQKQISSQQKISNYHKLADRCVKAIIQEGLRKKCMQNISVVIVFVGEILAQEDAKMRQNRSNTSTQVPSLNISFISHKADRKRKVTSTT